VRPPAIRPRREHAPARKRFGQHFLEPAWAAKVVRAVDAKTGDTFLEIGPGRGAITRPLAAASRRLLAVEIDRDLAKSLADAAIPNVAVVTVDFLDLTRSGLETALLETGADASAGFRVAGNLPYNVASPILFRLCEWHAEGIPVLDATLMLQREVADRLTARPGTGEYGVLSVLIPHVAAVNRLLELPPGAFRPPPNVRSTVVRLRFHEPQPAPRSQATFTALVRAVFTRRRKTLANALLALEGMTPGTIASVLDRATIQGQRRPETLEISEFVRLSDAISEPDPLPHTARR